MGETLFEMDAGTSPSSDADPRWWRSKEEASYHGIWQVAQRIYDDDSTRRATLMHHIRLYGARALLNTNDPDFIATSLPSRRLKYNAVQAVVETAVSRLGKNRPKAAFVTQGADWSLRQQSQLLSKYVEGTFYAEDIYSKGRRAFRDGGVTGTGVLKFFPRRTGKNKWRVGCERVRPWQILVDVHDGWDGSPRQLYQVHHVDREVLFEKYSKMPRWKKKKKQLREMLEAASEASLDTFNSDNVVNRVEVIEAWRLPSGAGAGDGRHAVAVSSGTLHSQEWEHEWFPFSFFRWQPPMYGHWGSGIAEAINGIQVAINRTLRVLEKSYQLMSTPAWMVPRGTKIDKDKMTTEIGRFIYYNGPNQPTVYAPKPVDNQFFQHLQQLKQDAFDLPGVSALSAQGKKPADLESGAALRQYNAIEDARHADPALNYEAFYMNAALIIVEMSRTMNENGMRTEVQAHYRRRWRRWIKPIAWSDMPKITEDNVALQITPTSILPSLPAGRTATIQQWMAAGFIDAPTAQYLLEIPDLEAYPSPNVAMIESILDDIESMLDGEEQRVAEPMQDLRLAQTLSVSSYLRARSDGAPEHVLEMLRIYMQSIDRLMKKGEQQQVAMQQQTQAQPPEMAPGMGLAQLQSQGTIAA